MYHHDGSCQVLIVYQMMVNAIDTLITCILHIHTPALNITTLGKWLRVINASMILSHSGSTNGMREERRSTQTADYCYYSALFLLYWQQYTVHMFLICVSCKSPHVQAVVPDIQASLLIHVMHCWCCLEHSKRKACQTFFNRMIIKQMIKFSTFVSQEATTTLYSWKLKKQGNFLPDWLVCFLLLRENSTLSPTLCIIQRWSKLSYLPTKHNFQLTSEFIT